MSRLSGTKFFITYNPWDNSTRKENHYRGMARLIAEIEADGYENYSIVNIGMGEAMFFFRLKGATNA